MSDFNSFLNDFNNTEDTTAQYSPDDIEKNKWLAVLSYLSWLLLIPLFAARDSRFAQYHVKQGILLAIPELIAWIVFGLLSLIPIIGILFSIINWLLNIIFLVFTIIGIINAVNGKAKKLPIIGNLINL